MMDALNSSAGVRHEYRVKGWLRVLYVLVGLLGLFATVLSFSVITCPANVFIGFALVVFFAAVSIYMLALALNSRLIIDGSRIEVHGAFSTHKADASDILGIRTIASGNGSYWQLRLKDDSGKITIPQSFASDDQLHAWFQQLTDLDERDRKSLLDEISHEEGLGATPDQRLETLKQARQLNIALHVVAVAAAVGLNLGNAALQVTSALVLAVAPVVAVFLVHREPLLYAFVKPRKDPRTGTSIIFLIAGFGFLVRNHGVHYVSLKPLLPTVVLLAVFCLGFLMASLHESPQFWRTLFAIIFFSALYSYSIATAADSLLDDTDATKYTTEVVGKHVSRGRSTTYYLDVAPWGPVEEKDRISVSYSDYKKASAGDTICLGMHPGTLHASWYRIVGCSAQ